MNKVQYRPQYFYLEDGNRIELMEVGRIASFATTLEPLEEVTEIGGYLASLHNYMSSNRDNLLFNSYTLLCSDLCGKKLLLSNIGLCLLEKSFRDQGASKDSIKSYVTIVNEYHNILNSNREMYEKIEHKSK